MCGDHIEKHTTRLRVTVQREVVEGKAAKLEAEGWQSYLDKMKTGKPDKKTSEK